MRLISAFSLLLLVACEATNPKAISPDSRPRGPAGQRDAGVKPSDYYANAEYQSLHTRAEVLGREIWLKATGGNERFYTYVIGQKISDRSIDFFRSL